MLKIGGISGVHLLNVKPHVLTVDFTLRPAILYGNYQSQKDNKNPDTNFQQISIF